MPEKKVWCKNLLCKKRPFKINSLRIDSKKDLDEAKCPECGQIGVMYKGETLTEKEVIDQVKSWMGVVAFRVAFKSINKKKLPKEIKMGGIKKRRKKTVPIKGR
jgi:hypothetical protein